VVVVTGVAEPERTTDVDPAFAAAYRACHRSVLRTAFVMCGSATSAEDVVGEATVRVYRAWRRGRVDNLEQYLRRAVVNETIGRSRRVAIATRAAPHLVPARPIAFEDAVADLDRLARALAQLPPRQRAAVVLRYLHDMTEAATADLLGVSVGTVKASVARGLARLRELLDVEDDDGTP
jgi:RNA polymerase sigma-70 factor (sigma-E family)